MFLIVGLGNPGPRYAGNRHNIGFMAVDEIVRRHGFGPWRGRFQGQVAEGRLDGQKLLALKPETYMNESGRAVGEALRFYKLEPAALFAFHDEIDLRFGKVKVKRGGGAGGHNGLRSIDAHVGQDYWRVRLGVGHPGHKDLVHPHVLKDFAKDEAKTVEKLLDAVAGELPKLIAGDDGAFMSRVAHLMAPPKPKSEPKPDPKAAEKAPAAPQDAEKTD
jgi:PTH1 family peptidyl-tRNA hydrolase